MNKEKTKKNGAGGFTLIETIVYVAILSMIATGLVSLAFSSSQEDRATIDGVINAYENL
ncbi:MAG: type II secretion system protein [Candidatus Pacebacteria bacterium]|nr:type II secretion system protein [Candidatus Paceibacterota bacterium]